MQLRTWTFRVQVETHHPGEVVGVVGNVPQLGDWRVESGRTVVFLTRETPASSDSENNFWSVTTWIPLSIDVHYRFYICIAVESEQYIIKQREVSLQTRVIKKDVLYENLIDRTWDVFGQTTSTGGSFIDRGWLTTETVVQFKLHSSPIHFWKEKLRRRRPLLKLTPVSLTKRTTTTSAGEELNENNSLSFDTQDSTTANDSCWPVTEVAVLNEEDAELRSQGQFGRELCAEDFTLFQVQLHHLQEMTFLFDLYMPSIRDDDDEPPEHIGFSYILPTVMKGSEGHVVVPITSTRHRPIGQLSVYYIVILPLPESNCDMSVSYSKYWKHSTLGLDVGHRGLGPSFKQKSCAEVRENTIASLKEAASHGADFVEFDVQLSKDLIPVIYHDFHVCISLKRKRVNEGDMLEFPLKELTLNQLQCLKDLNPTKPSKVLYFCGGEDDLLPRVSAFSLAWAYGIAAECDAQQLYHVQEGKEKQQLLFDDELEEHQPFPTLQHALEVIDPAVGFNIEIKWTMLLKDGTFELNNPFDLNIYLDSVLMVVLKHGGSRKIVFSCFHPDVCTMVKYKQSKYPVVFLTQGITTRYPMYHDPRCHTIPSAVYFAKCFGILGINVHTEDILRDPEQVVFAKNHGLVVFCWGDDNNNPETINYLKKLGLNAIIYDKIDQFGPKRKIPDRVYLSEGSEHQKELLEVADTMLVASDNAPSPPPTTATQWLVAAQQN